MRYSVSVLVRPEEEAERGELTNERWYTGTADVPDGSAPSAVLFPGEGDVALFPIDRPDADVEGAVPEAAEPDQGDANQGN